MRLEFSNRLRHPFTPAPGVTIRLVSDQRTIFPDPSALDAIPVYDLLTAASHGFVGIDQRFIRAIVDRGEDAVPDLLRFGLEDHRDDRVDLEEDLIAIFRYIGTPEALPYFLECVRREPDDIPDDLVEGILPFGGKALETVLELYHELEEDQAGDVAFLLAGLGVCDPRILELLIERLEFDVTDGAFCLGLYGDPAGKPALERALTAIPEEDADLRREIRYAIAQIDERPESAAGQDLPKLDIWELYAEEAPPPFEVLSDAEVLRMLDSAAAANRATAAESFRNREMNAKASHALFDHARSDPDAKVRANCWEALADSDEKPIRAAMKAVVPDTSRDIVERQGALVGLCNSSEDADVAQWMRDFYQEPATRAKAMEAMWRSFDRQFTEYFPKHLEDPDLEIRRQAIWGTGYMGVGGEAGRLTALFDDSELRQDALFAYALCVPGEISRGRARRLLRKIDDAAGGLSSGETELVKVAIDQRLVMHRMEPVFSQLDEADDSEPDSAEAAPPAPPPAPALAGSAKPGRNEPCPCRSGKKFKHCHGA